jgi:hypothetical protein
MFIGHTQPTEKPSISLSSYVLRHSGGTADSCQLSTGLAVRLDGAVKRRRKQLLVILEFNDP